MTDDLIVIGGGIHGVATAFEATLRGQRVRVIEQYHGLAQGTSSRSSKLIHGGLRYLEQGQWRLVRESLQARRHLLDVAPDLVELTDFYIPVYRDSRRRPLTIRLGLSLYALLGGLRPESRFEALSRDRWSTLDGLDTTGLHAVFRYRDARTNDRELTRALMYAACTRGAALHLGETVREVQLHAAGVEVATDAGTYQARALVNAAGPWVGEVLDRVVPRQPRPAVDLVAGTHIVVPGRLRQGVYYVEAPSDGRAVFLIPWNGQVMIGTTERGYNGDPGSVRPTEAEIDYLRHTAAHYFDAAHVDTGRVIEAFAGLRVLPTDDTRAFARKRDTRLLTDRAQRPRLVSIVGGKLTVHRTTALRALALLGDTLTAAAGSQAPPRLQPAPPDFAAPGNA